MANGRCGVGGGGGLSVGDITLKDKSADANFLACNGEQISASNYPTLTALMIPKSDASFVGKYVSGYASDGTNGAKKSNAIVIATDSNPTLYSTDDGETWSTVSYSMKSVTANSTAFFGANANTTVYKSTNGSSWSSKTVGSTFAKLNGQIAATDAGVVAFGSNYHFVSTDNGENYTQASLGTTFNATCCCVGFGYVWFYNATEGMTYQYSPGDEYPSSVDGGLSFTSSARMTFAGGKVLLYEGTTVKVRASANASFQQFTTPSSIRGNIVFVNGFFYFIDGANRVQKTADFVDYTQVQISGLSSTAKLYIDANDNTAIGYNTVNNSTSTLGKYNFEAVYELPNLIADFVSTPYIKAK